MTVRIATFIWTIMILVGTLMPKVAMDDAGMIEIPGLDKVVHVIMYAGFVYLWSRLLSAKAGRIKGARIAFSVSLGLGLVLEVLQWKLDLGRNFEIPDIIANISGSIIGLTAFYKIIKH